MKIIIIIKIIFLFHIFSLFEAVGLCHSTEILPEITVSQAQRFIEDQLDGGWGESFRLFRQTNLTTAEQRQEEELIRQTAWLLREVLVFKKRQPGRLSRTDYDCYSLKINGSLHPRTLYDLLLALRNTFAIVGVGNVVLGDDEFNPGIVCPADRQLFSETTTFVKFLAENYSQAE